VIGDFLASWPLFHDAWLAAWLLAAVLGAMGGLVVARDQIFIGAAVSQASMLGVALGLRAGDLLGDRLPWLRSDASLAAGAVLASVLAALVTVRAGRRRAGSHEARTGWLYLAAGSLGILAVAHSPHGVEEMHRLLASSMVGATRGDVLVFAVLGLGTLALLARFLEPLLLVSLDATMAAAVGLRVGLWEGLASCWLGLVMGLAIPTVGVLYAFGCLVLPALVAREVCHEMRPLFLVAPAVALLTAIGGCVLAHHWDYPPAQLTVAMLCGLALLAPAAGRLRTLTARRSAA
jgi:ABC-type Mn2+/Zn2+ transport system permease subunit